MIKRLLVLNGIATLGVVFNHATGWGFTAMFWWADRYRSVDVPNFDQIGSPSYYGLRFIEQFVFVSIPIFLFVSGYFVAFATGRKRKTIEWKTVGARIWYLLIPYILWSFIIFATEILQGDRTTFREYAYRLLTGKATVAFYYVPMIIQLYLLAPFLVRFARWRWWILLIIAGLLQFSVEIVRYVELIGLTSPALRSLSFFTQGWLFTSGVFWFSLGMVIGFHLKSFQRILTKGRRFLLVSTIIVFAVGMVEWELLLDRHAGPWLATRMTLVDSLLAAFFIFTLLAYEKSKLPLDSQLSAIGTKSYGIYLTHMLVLELTARAISDIAPGIMAYQLIFQIILVAAGLGIPLLMMTIANLPQLSARRYYRYVFG